MAADVRKLLTAVVEVVGGGAIGHDETGLYLQVGREWEGTWAKDRLVHVQMERKWMSTKALVV